MSDHQNHDPGEIVSAFLNPFLASVCLCLAVHRLLLTFYEVFQNAILLH